MLINNENIDEKMLSANLENFSFLREKAIEYIQQTATDNWTDFNIHDPGITILEALCYALSDVGFRLNFPVKDLLTDQNGNLVENAFYFPEEILPNHAVTVNDFRKILIDLPQVKNAWISPFFKENSGIEPDYETMFVYKKGSSLLLEKDVKKLEITPSEKQEILGCSIFIKGLYAINIEFEEQPVLGNIDSGESFEPIYEKDFFGDIYYDISNWNELANKKIILKTIAETYKTDKSKISLLFEVSNKNKYNNNDGKLFDRVLKEWFLNISVLCNGKLTFTFKNVLFVPYFENGNGISGTKLTEVLASNNFAFFDNCFARIAALSKAYSDVQDALHANRNLCEDYLPQISAIPTIEFRICADIDVESSADIEQVQAAIFYAIEQYISPAIKFYTMQQMLAKGKSIEEILEGPKLQNGFICEEEMGQNSFQDYSINLSDIINAIYETEGLVNCRNVQLYLMDENGKNIIAPNSWEIKVPSGYKPVLNKRRSKFIFYKNELPLSANFRESIIKLSILSAANFKNVGSEVQRPVFNNTNRDLAIHYALANEFPATYKIGKNFPENPEYLNNPKYFTSKQLEGYLLMFDQLIANFLKDIDQFKNTMSWNDVEHIQHSSTKNDWRKSYLVNNKNVDGKWQNSVESKSKFLKKRNESLDFLLSRFAEDLHDLDNYFYLSIDNLDISQNDYYQYLINLKQRFLSNFITISANRGAAIDFRNNATYLQAKPSGYEERLANLLGCELQKNNIRKTVADIDESNKNERGYFHVLEHVLLRIPDFNNDIIQTLEIQNIQVKLLSICAEDDCTACGGFDPYSFTATVVLPSWINVYADVRYRDYIEKLIRKETPAHVLLRICWIDKPSMKNYEEKIEVWWNAKQGLLQCNSITYSEKAVDFLKAQNDFIKVVKSQRSDYFPATLHGCEDEGEENNTRIFLNKTILGNRNKTEK
jgi:hypothetical protein